MTYFVYPAPLAGNLIVAPHNSEGEYNPDGTVAPFNLGDDVTGAMPWQVVTRSFLIVGIPEGETVLVEALGEALVSVGTGFFTAVTAGLDDTIQVQLIASDKFETTVEGGAKVGIRQDSFTVTTGSSASLWVDLDLGGGEDWEDDL